MNYIHSYMYVDVSFTSTLTNEGSMSMVYINGDKAVNSAILCPEVAGRESRLLSLKM